MTTLLYIESSPRHERSHSTAVSRAFIDAYLNHHPDHTVDTWDLWSTETPLMEFNGDVLTAKYAARGGNPQHTPGEQSAWAEVARQIDRLKRADKLLLSVPIWNFGVPYKFKHWVDVVTQPNLSFRPDPVLGPQGLLKASKALLVSARGGSYTPGTPREALDLCTPYVRRWLWMVGIHDLTVLDIDGTSLSETSAQEARAKGVERAQALAGDF